MIHDKLKYKEISSEQRMKIMTIKQVASNLLDLIEMDCPECDYKETAMERIAESIMWASKAISHN